LKLYREDLDTKVALDGLCESLRFPPNTNASRNLCDYNKVFKKLCIVEKTDMQYKKESDDNGILRVSEKSIHSNTNYPINQYIIE